MRPAEPTAASAPERARQRRPEVEGLRGLAVALVVVYHVWIGRVSGGVDVFFVLSGFFLTTMLVREVAPSGRVRVGPYARRLLRRLTPAAGIVLAATTLAGVLLLPRTTWADTAPQVLSALFYVENWHLALTAADYGADHAGASPVQHFWSLSVQGQVYLLWPLLLVLGIRLLRGPLRGPRRAAAATLVVVFLASLAWSVVRTGTAQEFTYFDTTARLWEFAAGGLLALVGHRVRLGRRTRVALGWAGVLGLVSLGALVDVTSSFPGWLALWPVGCALAVLVAGRPISRWGVDHLLASSVGQWLGNRSYALYLWHWPVLIVFLSLTGRPVPGLGGGLLVVVGSVVLAEVTTRGLRRLGAPRPRAAHAPPPRTDRPRTPLFVLRWTAPALVAALVWTGYVEVNGRVAFVPVGDPDHPGARAMADGFVYEGAADADLVPSATAIGGDTVWWSAEEQDAWTCDDTTTPEAEFCTAIDTTAGSREVVIVGDSHSLQLTYAFRELAADRDYRLVYATRGGCPLTLAPAHLVDSPASYRECAQHNQEIVDTLVADPPALVVTIGSRGAIGSPAEEVPAGYQQAWDALAEAGIPVLAVRDNARFTADPNVCLERAGNDLGSCAADRSEAYADGDPLAEATARRELVHAFDTVPLLCAADGACSMAIGNVRVYHDDNHLSGTYVRTMAPYFAEVLDALGL